MKAKVQPLTEPYPLCNKSCGIFCVLILDTLYLVLRRAPNPVGSFATCVSEEKSPKAISPACAICNCAFLLQGILIRILIGLVTMSSSFSYDHLVACVNTGHTSLQDWCLVPRIKIQNGKLCIYMVPLSKELYRYCALDPPIHPHSFLH